MVYAMKKTTYHLLSQNICKTLLFPLLWNLLKSPVKVMLLWHYSRIYIFFNKPLITENEFIELIRNLLIVQSTLHI